MSALVAIEYLGNKTRLLDFVTRPIASVRGLDSIADLFCGTASVSSALRAQGLRVVANDHLRLCATLAEAALLADGPPRDYAQRLATLNALAPEPGFFHRTYSPAGGRMYLTEHNAAKVDAIRAEIERWDLDRAEKGDAAARSRRRGRRREQHRRHLRLLPEDVQAARAAAADAGARPGRRRARRRGAAARTPSASPAVCAPTPSTSTRRTPSASTRAYYHLLETLVSGETPDVEGSTGLPPWRSSDFCYKRRAPGALARLLARLDVPHVFLSYSDEGHIAHEEILEILGGRVRWWELTSQRFRSSALDHKSDVVRERLYHRDAA